MEELYVEGLEHFRPVNRTNHPGHRTLTRHRGPRTGSPRIVIGAGHLTRVGVHRPDNAEDFCPVTPKLAIYAGVGHVSWGSAGVPSPKLLARFRVNIVVARRPERPPVRKPAGQSLTSSPTGPIALILARRWPTILSNGQHACHGTISAIYR
jgi:hypothetical protein